MWLCRWGGRVMRRVSARVPQQCPAGSNDPLLLCCLWLDLLPVAGSVVSSWLCCLWLAQLPVAVLRFVAGSGVFGSVTCGPAVFGGWL